MIPWRETAGGDRWIRAHSTDVPIFTDHEIGRMAIALTVGVIVLVGGALVAGAVHPPAQPLPGNNGLAAAIAAATGIPVLYTALRRPQRFVTRLPVVAFAGATSLSLAAALVSSTFAPFVTMSYLLLQLMASVFLSRRLSHVLVGTIAVLPLFVGEISDRGPDQVRGQRTVSSTAGAVASHAACQVDFASPR